MSVCTAFFMYPWSALALLWKALRARSACACFCDDTEGGEDDGAEEEAEAAEGREGEEEDMDSAGAEEREEEGAEDTEAEEEEEDAGAMGAG